MARGVSAMRGRKESTVFECVLVDINTQEDYCDPHGAYPVGNAAELLPALRKVVAWTKRNLVPTVSSIESRRATELTDSGTPICCLDGSVGQKKIPFTLLPKRAIIEIDNTLAIPTNFFRRYQQVIFRKRTDDLLANPKADRLLTQLPVREFIVIGAGLETSVKAAVLGLLARNKRVTVVTDACGYAHEATGILALRQMVAKGATTTTVDELLRRKLDRKRRSWYCTSRVRMDEPVRARLKDHLNPHDTKTRPVVTRHDLDPATQNGCATGPPPPPETTPPVTPTTNNTNSSSTE